MTLASKAKIAFLFFGDIVALYFALFLTIILRYGDYFVWAFREQHFWPFSIIFAIWIGVFYIAGLYDLRRLRNNLDFLKTLAASLATNFAIAIFFFYLVPAFGIAPRRNLFLFLVLFTLLEIFWRRSFNGRVAQEEAPNKVALISNGGSDLIDKILSEDPRWLPQLGYEITTRLPEEDILSRPEKIKKLAEAGGINFIVIPRRLKNNDKLTRVLYELLGAGVEIRDLPSFYEAVARKVPLSEVEESWFLENLIGQQKFYDPLKRGWEFLSALLLFLVLLPLNLLIAAVIKLTSRGPVIYKQVRVGQQHKNFMLYKFRSMPVDAEKDGAAWARPDDARPTPFGKFLRKTHLDELPQLWNILKGDLSFVGPRPERPEFVKILKDKIPYYEARLLIKPGVTGWAQIHHRSDMTEKDVTEKLQYDLYYIKNRSPILDLAIILKTVKTLFTTPK